MKPVTVWLRYLFCMWPSWISIWHQIMIPENRAQKDHWVQPSIAQLSNFYLLTINTPAHPPQRSKSRIFIGFFAKNFLFSFQFGDELEVRTGTSPVLGAHNPGPVHARSVLQHFALYSYFSLHLKDIP